MGIRVFLVSNYPLLAWGLTRLLESSAGRHELVHWAKTLSPQTDAAVLRLSADIVLLDWDMGPQDALQFVRRLGSAGVPGKIVLLTRLDDNALQEQAMMLGARGIIEQNAPPEMVLAAISKVHEGQLWLNREATARILGELTRGDKSAQAASPHASFDRLTEREKEIVRCIAQHANDSGKTIARMLHISESTLRNHLTSVYHKLGVANSNGLHAYAVQHGLAKAPMA